MVALTLMLSVAAVLNGQQRTGGQQMTTPISASVMTTFITRVADRQESIAAIVLWRGHPGWFAGSGASGSSGSGSGLVTRHRFYRGGQDFEVVLNDGARTLQLLGTTIDLRQGNVVFVDGVASDGGPRVIRTSHVDGAFDASAARTPERLIQVLARTSEIREYLRCEVPLPNAALQQQLRRICDRIMGGTTPG